MSRCSAHDAAYEGRLALQDAAYGEPVPAARVAADLAQLVRLVRKPGWQAVCFGCGKEWHGPLYWHQGCGGG